MTLRHLSTLAAALGALAVLCGSAFSARVVEVRVGSHPTFTRVVFELDEPAGYRIERRDVDGGEELVVKLAAASAPRHVKSRSEMVEAVDLVSSGGESVARVRLRGDSPRVKELILGGPPRIVIDVMRPEQTLAGAPPPRLAVEAEPKEATPEPEAPKTAAPKTADSAVAPKAAAPVAPKAAKEPATPRVSGRPKAPEAAVQAEAPRAAEKPAEPKVSKQPAQPLPAGTPARPAADAPKLATPPEQSAEAAKPATPPEQSADAPKLATPPEQSADAPKLAMPPEQSADAPKLAMPPSQKPADAPGARFEDALEGERIVEPRVARPDTPAPDPRATPPAPGSPPDAPPTPAAKPPALAKTPPASAPVRRDAESKGLFGLEFDASDPWLTLGLVATGLVLFLVVVALLLRRHSRPTSLDALEVSREITEPAGEDDAYRTISGAGASAAPSFPAAGPGLFDDEQEKGESEMDVPAELPIERGSRAAMGPMAVGGDSGQAEALQALERRMAQLESRLDEANEARERLERQVTAQSEELRVQRAAIARTQRALRGMTRVGEEQATEPALRDPAKPGAGRA